MKNVSLIFYLLSLIFLAGCKRFPNPFEGEKVVARAGKQTLRQMDVARVVPAEITGADSTAWVADYVNRWVRDRLKLQMAEKLFAKNEAEDEELLDSYRDILKNRRLEQHFVAAAAGDSLYTETDLHEYYASHTRDFTLDRTIVKGRVMIVPAGFRQRAELRRLFADFSGSAREEAVAMAEKNGIALRVLDDWTEYPQFLALLPTRRNQSYDDLVSGGSVQEMTDGGVVYYFVFTDRRRAGETSPYELVADIVRQTVATTRRAAIVRAAEDSIFNNAILNKKAIIAISD